METKDLIANAQGREFTAFDAATKELLSTKVAEKLQEKGYFDRLDHAKGLVEGENPFAKKGDDEEKDDDKDDKDEDKDDKDEDKGSDDEDDSDDEDEDED